MNEEDSDLETSLPNDIQEDWIEPEVFLVRVKINPNGYSKRK